MKKEDICKEFECNFRLEIDALKYIQGSSYLKLLCHYWDSSDYSYILNPEKEKHLIDFVKFYFELKDNYKIGYKNCLEYVISDEFKARENFISRIGYKIKLKKFQNLMLNFDKFQAKFEQTFFVKMDNIHQSILDKNKQEAKVS